MRWKYILRIIGILIVFVGLTMFFPLVFGLYYKDSSVIPLLQSIFVTVLSGGLCVFLFRNEKVDSLSNREGMAIVALAWGAAGIAGALPFYFSDTFAKFVDCVFETVSGFTTTGSSVLSDFDSVPRGIFMWRSLTHWLGGMGIIVLSLAILPILGVGGMQLYKAEVPGPVPDKLRPRMKDTAMALWGVYVLLSVAETVLLLFGGMDLFESICHTFGTMATGGFSPKAASIGFYNSTYIDVVIIVFMFLAGINFYLHYQFLRGKPLILWRDPEFRFFSLVILLFTLASAMSIFRTAYVGFGEALRYAAFQVVSITTTTGYVTADYELWTPLPQVILFFCMFIGASAGSTGGGIKCMRILLLLKCGYREIIRLIHPRIVTKIKMGGQLVPDSVMSSIWGFFLLYIGLFVFASLLLAAMGIDMITSFSAVAATIGNIGPGFGKVGPASNYAGLPEAAKWILTLCMLMGRLEIYTIIILFVPEFWRK